MSKEIPKVQIENQPVKVKVEEAPDRLVTFEEHLTKAPTTTSEENLHTAGQRKVNLIWEFSQAFMSNAVVLTTCIGVLEGKFSVNAIAFPAEWWAIVGLVIGFYFGRTNHQRVGGVDLGR